MGIKSILADDSTTISTKMKLAVQAFTHKEEGWSVHMKVIPTTRTTSQGGDKGKNKGDQEPDTDDTEYNLERRGEHQSQLDHREVNKNCTP